MLPALWLPLALGAAAVVAAIAGLVRLDAGLHAVAFHTVVTGIQCGTLAVAGVCAAWVVATAPERSTAGASHREN